MAESFGEKRRTEEESVLFSVAYFNLLDYAPTTFELWRHLLTEEKTSFLLITRALKRLEDSGKIFTQNGFWYLKEKAFLAEKRIRGKKISQGKTKRLRVWGRWLEKIPFLEGVFVNGALALGTADKNSDWDVLIITKKKRIWLARFFLMLFLELFQKRRSGRDDSRSRRDRFCLNHFLTEDGLILEKRNQFIAHESTFCFPLLGADLQRKYLNLNYFWLKNRRANFSADEIDFFWTRKINSFWWKKRVENFLQKSGWAEWGNSLLKKWMIRLIKNNPKTAWPGADIRYSDQALVFIPRPWRDGLEKEAEKILEKNGGDPR